MTYIQSYIMLIRTYNFDDIVSAIVNKFLDQGIKVN